MIYGVGTGRCGTRSLAESLGGLHEPEPKLHVEALRYYLDPSRDLRTVYDALRKRAGYQKPIVDNFQSLFINQIAEVDPDAQFIWLIRDRAACVNSFMHRAGEAGRIRPRWFSGNQYNWEYPAGWDKRRYIEWYYDEVNWAILSQIVDKRYKIVRTEDLGVWLNANCSTPT